MGYLSVISGKGHLAVSPVSVINQFAVRENAADVQVGDDTYTGMHGERYIGYSRCYYYKE
jgi:hypothetical protein